MENNTPECLSPFKRRELVEKLLGRDRTRTTEPLPVKNVPVEKLKKLSRGKLFTILDVQIRDNEEKPGFLILFRFTNKNGVLPKAISCQIKEDGSPTAIMDADIIDIPTDEVGNKISRAEGVWLKIEEGVELTAKGKALVARLDELLTLAVESQTQQRARN